MNKKIILGLGTMTVAMAPIITVVSCGGGDDSTESGSGIRPIVAGAKVVTTNVPGIHFECSGFDNYLVIDGSKITPEEFAKIDPSSLQLSGGSAGQIQSAITNHQMPVLRVINAPDQSGYYDVLGMDQPTLPQDQGVIPGTAQGNGVRGTTIQGYNGDTPYYNIDGKWYTDLSHIVAGTNATSMIFKQGSSADAVNNISDISGVQTVINLDFDALPDTINVDGRDISKYSFVSSQTDLAKPGYYEKTVSTTNGGSEDPLDYTSLFEANGMFFETKEEAALHLGYTKETDFDAYATRVNATGVKVSQQSASRTAFAPITGAVGSQMSVLGEARNSEYFSVNKDQDGNVWAIDEDEDFPMNFNLGNMAHISQVNFDDSFIATHQTFTLGKTSIMNNVVTETTKTYTYKRTEDGAAISPAFYSMPPQDTQAQPFDLSDIDWSFNGKYYTSDDAFMNANGYSRSEVFVLRGSQHIVSDERPFVQATSEIPPKYNVGDKIFIDGVEYTIA